MPAAWTILCDCRGRTGHTCTACLSERSRSPGHTPNNTSAAGENRPGQVSPCGCRRFLARFSYCHRPGEPELLPGDQWTGWYLCLSHPGRGKRVCGQREHAMSYFRHHVGNPTYQRFEYVRMPPRAVFPQTVRHTGREWERVWPPKRDRAAEKNRWTGPGRVVSRVYDSVRITTIRRQRASRGQQQPPFDEQAEKQIIGPFALDPGERRPAPFELEPHPLQQPRRGGVARVALG